MKLIAYAIAEEGADRVYIQTTPPNVQRCATRRVYRVEIPLPDDVVEVDGVIALSPAQVRRVAG